MAPLFLIETCLLTHGLYSISDEFLYNVWPKELNTITWIDNGEIIIGSIDEFIPFRNKTNIQRIDYKNLDNALNNKISGALTASGTMAACNKVGAKVAISCGLGGFVNSKSAISSDINSLISLDIPLIATAFKDMFEIEYSVRYLENNNVIVLGYKTNNCSGYILNGKPCVIKEMKNEKIENHCLLLNPIPETKRIQDYSLLEQCIESGIEAEKNGEYFHPAVNKSFDIKSNGISSKIQLESIIENAYVAASLTK